MFAETDEGEVLVENLVVQYRLFQLRKEVLRSAKSGDYELKSLNMMMNCCLTYGQPVWKYFRGLT